MVHGLHVACASYPRLKICLDSRAFVRDSFARTKWKLLCLFTPLYPSRPQCVHTPIFERRKKFMFNFFRMLDIMTPDAFSLR